MVFRFLLQVWLLAYVQLVGKKIMTKVTLSKENIYLGLASSFILRYGYVRVDISQGEGFEFTKASSKPSVSFCLLPGDQDVKL